MLSFAHQNRGRPKVIKFMYIPEGEKGGGTPAKRIPEGVFLCFSTMVALSLSSIKKEFVLYFWSFCS